MMLVLTVLCASAATAPSQSTPRHGRKAVYDRYASRPDLAVGSIDGFKLNDSVKVDVLIIVADNDAAWQKLCTEFDIRTQRGVTTWTGQNDHPESRTKWLGKPACKVIASPARRTVCMYYINNEAEYESLMDYQMNLMTNKKH